MKTAVRDTINVTQRMEKFNSISFILFSSLLFFVMRVSINLLQLCICVSTDVFSWLWVWDWFSAEPCTTFVAFIRKVFILVKVLLFIVVIPMLYYSISNTNDREIAVNI